MKHLKRIVVTLAAVFALLLVFNVKAEASITGGSVSFSSKTDTSVTVSWTAPTINNEYYSSSSYVYTIDSYSLEINSEIVGKVSASSRKATVTGLAKGWYGYVYVYANYTQKYTDSSGTVSYSTSRKMLGSAKCNTTPGNATWKSISPYTN